MKRNLFYIGVSSLASILFLTACGSYSGKDIADSIEKISTEETQTYIPMPSNRRVNEEKKLASKEIVTYMEHFGYYLRQFNKNIEQMNDFFYNTTPTEATFQKAKQQVLKLQALRNEISTHKLPKELTGLNNVHHSTLRELDLLTTSIEEVNLQDSGTFQRAKNHYENTVISLSLTEREYLTILTDYGLK